MTDDLQVSNSIAGFIRFIKRNKNTLFLFVSIGVSSTIFFQKFEVGKYDEHPHIFNTFFTRLWAWAAFEWKVFWMAFHSVLPGSEN